MLLFGVVVYFGGIATGDLRLDGAVYGWVAKRMVVTGEWLTPYFDWGDTPYFNKPPLMFWLAAICCKIFGIGDAAVKIPSAAFGLLCVVMTYRIARRSLPPSGAALAGLILIANYIFKRNTAGFRLDSATTFCFLLSAESGFQLLNSPRRARNPLAWTLLGIATGAGLMLKGGVILMALPILIIAFAAARRWDILFAPGWILAFLVTLIIAAPWHVMMYEKWGSAFWKTYIGKEVGDRLAGKLQRPEPWYYYLRLFIRFYWPWLPFALIGIVTFFRQARWRAPDGMLLASWLVVYTLGIHATPAKYDRYLMPIFPLLSIFAADALRSTRAGQWIESRFLPWAGATAVAVWLALLATHTPIYTYAVPEIHQAAPIIDEAMRSSKDPDRPRLYAHHGVHARYICNLLFYTHDLDRRRFRQMTSKEWHPLPHDAFLAVAPGDIEVVREHYTRAQLVSAGRNIAIFRMADTPASPP